MKDHKPAKAKLSVLAQVCKLIPTHLTANLATKYGMDKQARTFSAWSHVVTRLFTGGSYRMRTCCEGSYLELVPQRGQPVAYGLPVVRREAWETDLSPMSEIQGL